MERRRGELNSHRASAVGAGKTSTGLRNTRAISESRKAGDVRTRKESQASRTRGSLANSGSRTVGKANERDKLVSSASNRRASCSHKVALEHQTKEYLRIRLLQWECVNALFDSKVQTEDVEETQEIVDLWKELMEEEQKVLEGKRTKLKLEALNNITEFQEIVLPHAETLLSSLQAQETSDQQLTERLERQSEQVSLGAGEIQMDELLAVLCQNKDLSTTVERKLIAPTVPLRNISSTSSQLAEAAKEVSDGIRVLIPATDEMESNVVLEQSARLQKNVHQNSKLPSQIELSMERLLETA